MNILITGGAGFIGSQLGYYLYKLGHKITLVDNLSFGNKDNLIINNEKFGEFVLEDIRNDLSKYLHEIDVVFHFAAIAPLPVNQSNPYLSINVNVAGWVNVLEQCRRAKIKKIILASTSAVYENNIKFPVTENDEINPSLIYSITKKQAEELAFSFSSVYEMDITILRFFNVYGPHHDYKRKSPPLIAYIIKSLMANEKPVLHSDGKQERDYVYINDVCEACELVINNPLSKNEIFNIASNTVVSVNEIYKIIQKKLATNIQPIFRAPELLWDKYPELEEGYPLHSKWIAKETNKYCLGNYNKINKILGWRPSVSLQQGLEETMNFIIKDSNKI